MDGPLSEMMKWYGTTSDVLRMENAFLLLALIWDTTSPMAVEIATVSISFPLREIRPDHHCYHDLDVIICSFINQKVKVYLQTKHQHTLHMIFHPSTIIIIIIITIILYNMRYTALCIGFVLPSLVDTCGELASDTDISTPSEVLFISSLLPSIDDTSEKMP